MNRAGLISGIQIDLLRHLFDFGAGFIDVGFRFVLINDQFDFRVVCGRLRPTAQHQVAAIEAEGDQPDHEQQQNHSTFATHKAPLFLFLVFTKKLRATSMAIEPWSTAVYVVQIVDRRQLFAFAATFATFALFVPATL
jgi:hypothetical protein